MNKLIVRADDLGYTEGVTLGILAAHRDGIVTCTSLMVNMPYSKEAVRLAKQYPNLSLGLHVNVTNGKALADANKIPHLIDGNGVH
ncbi:MAG: ChbG/HpnK family deacetylase [Coprobacillaceae bacterium]